MFENTCSYCDAPVDAMTQWCSECEVAINSHYANQTALLARRAEGKVPPFTVEDVQVLLKSQEIGHRVEVNSQRRIQRFHANIKEWGEAHDRWKPRTGRQEKISTTWLRQQDPSRGRQVLYKEWLEWDEGKATPEKKQKRFNEVWRRLFGADK